MENNQNINHFSRLTSPLLTLILSFLPFKEAVRTSILSKQWLNIWKETKNLEFNERFFVRINETEENQDVQRGHFINFFREFVRNYLGSDILKLILSCSRPENFVNEMINFVTFAVSHNVKALELDFSDQTWDENDLVNHAELFELPLNVYPHGDLESLRLFSCSFDHSRFNSFTSLKNLSLGWISLRMSSIRNLLVNCPMLETLSLKKCWNIETIDISMSNLRLKNLVLDKCDFLQHYFYIEGPKLKYFKYSGKVGQFYMENQREMDRAELDFGLETEFEEAGNFLYELVGQLFSVQILTVCGVLLQIIPNGDEPLSIRPPLNVRHLILKTTLHSNVFCGLKFMLKSCPLLGILTLHLTSGRIFPDYEPPYPFNPQEFWSINFVVESCVEQRLQVINFRGFKGTLNELNVIKYFLYFGRVLKKLKLYLSNEEGQNGENWETYLARVQIVMQFQKASQDLQILVFRSAY